MTKVWIEAAINGPWGKARQPGIPVTTQEIVADGVASAKAAFVSAVVDLDLKEVACKREVRLAKKNISSEKEVQEAQWRHAEDESSLKSAVADAQVGRPRGQAGSPHDASAN